MKKKISFILPAASRKPVGGFKIVYEYANRLINDGYEVNIVLPASLLWKERDLKEKIKSVIRYFYFKIIPNKYLPYSWFPLDKRISIFWVPSLEEKYIPEADFVFATACETAEYIKNYKKSKGKKFYLIQHFEEWFFSKERVLKTWKYNFKKIVIADWLLKISESINEKSTLIYNGLDFQKFNLDIKLEEKKSKKLIMLYHESEWKGTEIGLKALSIVKERIKDVDIILFGAYKKPENLPNYIRYYQNPEQNILRKLYNEASIYVGTSYGEGWGLTVSEAMQCGCTIVCTNVNGYNEMVKNNETGLLSPSGNFEKLSENIIKLIENQELRIRLGNNGNKFIQRFTWERAYSKLKKELESCE